MCPTSLLPSPNGESVEGSPRREVLIGTHCFLLRSPSFSNLVLQEERVTRLMAEKQTADFVYLDFVRAFDSVVHRFLLGKLKSSGIDRAVLNWIE